MSSTVQLSSENFARHFDYFRQLMSEHPESNEAFTDFRSGLVAEWEEYKGDIYRGAQKRLARETWSAEEIGTGLILERVLNAIEEPGNKPPGNNLVHWQARHGESSRSHRKLLEARGNATDRHELEQILYGLYAGTLSEPNAFEALAAKIGRRYDVLAYLFFILDDQRYTPIATKAFEHAFELLGVPLRLSQRASWQNYQGYLARLRAVREQLERAGLSNVRLIDAHTFCFILGEFSGGLWTTAELAERIGRFDFEVDARRFPDERRRGRFRVGWKAAAEAQPYSEEALRKLTWENLGYRLGRDLDTQAVKEIDRVFELASQLYKQERFEETMKHLYRRIGRETETWRHRYRDAVRNRGGLAYAKSLLGEDSKVTEGFQDLVALGRANLTVEALVTTPRFESLFTAAELELARSRLAMLPAEAFPIRVSPERIHPETLPNSAEYSEGHVQTVTVNRYERSAKARAACLRHHGHRCAVCRLDFAERYGEIGEGFIHVHHRRPLRLRKEKYRIDPKDDLIPVCPNCHAMLHKEEPPMDIDELRALLRD